MPNHVRELMLILRYGFIPTLDSLSEVRWEHPVLDHEETTQSAAELCRNVLSRVKT
jgi:hypothetical protein